MTTHRHDDRAATSPSAVRESGGTWSVEQIRALGVMTDLMTAASILGIGRTTAYQLVRNGDFPVPVIRVGRSYRVGVAPLLRLLGAHVDVATLDCSPEKSVHAASQPADSARAQSEGSRRHQR